MQHVCNKVSLVTLEEAEKECFQPISGHCWAYPLYSTESEEATEIILPPLNAYYLSAHGRHSNTSPTDVIVKCHEISVHGRHSKTIID